MSTMQYGVVLVVAIISGLIGGVIARLLPVGVLRAARFEAIDDRGELRASLDKSGLVFFAKEELIPPVALDAEQASLRLYAGNRISISPGDGAFRLSNPAGGIIWEAPQQPRLTDIVLAQPPSPAAIPVPPPLPPQPPIDVPATIELPPTEAPVVIEMPPQSAEERFATRKRVPHPACPYCFKEACDNCYGIYEEVPGTGMIILRHIPDPAPLRPGETRPRFTQQGEPIWYVGDQGIIGPTDEEPVSLELPISLIELKRIQARHQGEIFSIGGVYGFGIGAKGFVVMLHADARDKVSKFPKTLEGVPVELEIGGSRIGNK